MKGPLEKPSHLQDIVIKIKAIAINELIHAVDIFHFPIYLYFLFIISSRNVFRSSGCDNTSVPTSDVRRGPDANWLHEQALPGGHRYFLHLHLRQKTSQEQIPRVEGRSVRAEEVYLYPGTVSGFSLQTIGENWELVTDQLVVCRATTLFTKSAKVWNRGFNWLACMEFCFPDSKEIS